MGLQRNYCTTVGIPIYVYRDSCLENWGVTTDFYYTSLNYSSWEWSATATLPFGNGQGGTCDNENFYWTTEFTWGPWDDYPFPGPFISPANNVGIACRKGSTFPIST